MRLHTIRSAAAICSLGLLFAVPAISQSTPPDPAPPQTDAPPPPPPPDGGPHRGGPERGNPEHRAEMLQHSLSLTPDQTTAVKSLLTNERAQMEALHSGNGAAQGDRRSQAMAIHQDTDTKLRALLTPDQASRYDAMEAHMREHRHGGGGDGNAPPPTPPGPSEQ